MKPILKKGVESVQHPSGLLSKQISKENLIKDFAIYVHTHSHLYENAEELKSYLSLKAGKITNPIGSAVRAVMVNIEGVSMPAFVANGQKQSIIKGKEQMLEILKKRALENTNNAPIAPKNGKNAKNSITNADFDKKR